MKIEKGIKIQGKWDGEEAFTTQITEALYKMAIEDSFVVSSDLERIAVLQRGRKLKMKLTSRKLQDGRYRVWYLGPREEA